MRICQATSHLCKNASAALVHCLPSLWLYSIFSTSSHVGVTSVSFHQGSDSKPQYTLDTFCSMLSFHIFHKFLLLFLCFSCFSILSFFIVHMFLCSQPNNTGHHRSLSVAAGEKGPGGGGVFLQEKLPNTPNHFNIVFCRDFAL